MKRAYKISNIRGDNYDVSSIWPFEKIKINHMKTKSKILLNLLLCVMPMMLHASNILPVKNIKPLPHLETLVSYERSVEIPNHTSVTPTVPVDQTMFSEMNLEINEMIKEMETSAAPMNGTQFGDFMVSLHKADASGKVKKAKKVIEKAQDIGKYIDALTGGDLVSMPLIKKQEIGSTIIEIIFNSAKIYPQYAEIEVYVKITIPNKKFDSEGNTTGVDYTELYFAADDIKFSQEKGVIAGSVGLLADYAFRVGDSDDAGVYLKKMSKTLNGDPENESQNNDNNPLNDVYDYSGTYINFDCDGFKEIGIGGRIYFSRNWLTPTNELGVPLAQSNDENSDTPRVLGDFQLTVQDWNDFLVNVSLDHFVLTQFQDMSFYIGNATLDLSTYRNPAGIPYSHAQDEEWEGVYIESIAVTLPEPFKRTCNSYGSDPNVGNNDAKPETCRIKVSAKHLLIDEFGVFGKFSLQGQVPLIGGAVMDGEWGWSLDDIALEFEASNIKKFEFGGQLGVPIVDKNDPLAYDGWYMNSSNFGLDIVTTAETKFPIWNAAQVTLSYIEGSVDIVDGEFKPSVSLTGSLTIGNPNDYGNSQGGSPVKMPGIEFTNLRLATSAPIISVENIKVLGGSSKVVGFPVTIDNITLKQPSPNNPDETRLGFNLTIKLMDSENSAVEAGGSLDLVGQYERDLNGTRLWKYKSLDFLGAQVKIALPHFCAIGTLVIFEEDPVYGQGFYANVRAGIIGDKLKNGNPEDGKYALYMTSIFGSNDSYRYWLVDGLVTGLEVPLFGPFLLDGVGGGAFHHMKPDRYQEPGSEGMSPIGQSTSGIVYKPYSATKLGIKFSTALKSKGNLMNGLLTLIMRFGDNFSLQNITFWGTGDIMIPSAKQSTETPDISGTVADNVKPTDELKHKHQTEVNDAPNGKIKAKIGLSLDFEHGFSFHGLADVKFNVANTLMGHGTLDILYHNPTNKWHFWLGGYYDGSTKTYDFFNPGDEASVPLYPVTVRVKYGKFNVRASAYFLTGNDIPGPPPAAPEVIAFFGNEANQSNRGKLDCDGNDPALGTGIAFGASAFFDFSKRIKGIFGSCVLGLKVKVLGGIGFDLALLKYAEGMQCSMTNEPSKGFNGWRATGRVFAFAEIQSSNITCIPLPELGAGAKINFDVKGPSYLGGTLVLKAFGEQANVGFSVGDRCGVVCQ